MIYDYDNDYLFGSAKFSEIERTFTELYDWSGGSAQTLTLWFYGDADNDASVTEQMYVGLEDSSGAGSYAEVRYGDSGEDMDDITKQEWQSWNIELTDFSGTNLAAVEKMYIGFGDRNDPVPGGSGVVYFDDIALSEPTCIPSLRSISFGLADMSDDCIISLADLSILANEWLSSDSITADLYTDGIVDFKDFALLAASWLETEGMWP